MKRKQRTLGLFLIIALCLTVFTGCIQEGANKEETIVDTKTAVLEHMAKIQSVETNVTLDMKAHIGMQGAPDSHIASIGSDITMQMTADPLALHTESYSRITVDGEYTRDDREYYIVENGEEMQRYDYVSDDEWKLSTLTKAESLAVPCQTGLIYDWNTFLTHVNDDNMTEVINDKPCFRLSGEVPATLLQEFFGDNVFGSFMHSTEMLLSDLIPCVLYVDCETYYPEQVNLTFTNNFIVSDMVFDHASVTVNYSKWNELSEIEIPKRVEVVAIDSDLEFYGSYYAWNLFLPYVKGDKAVDDNPPVENSGLSFQADWSSLQIRIDGNLTALPLIYSDLEKLGYVVDTVYSSTILDANNYLENIPVKKGSDTLYCTFYNADTVPQSIVNCYIGTIDLSTINNTTAGIEIYLPGEIALGINSEALISAYGEPDILERGFSCDTYIWNGTDANEKFLAEVSPVNNTIIRIYLEAVPLKRTDDMPQQVIPTELEPIADIEETKYY